MNGKEVEAVIEHRIGRSSDLPEGGRLVVRVGDLEIGVFRHHGRLYAYENHCLHQGGPVCEGMLLGKVEAILGEDQSYLGERFSEQEIHIVCPWHGWEYDLATGECAADRKLRLRRIDVVERGDEVYVVL